MAISISRDKEKCANCSTCATLAPYGINWQKLAFTMRKKGLLLPDSFKKEAEEAKENCPNDAISTLSDISL